MYKLVEKELKAVLSEQKKATGEQLAKLQGWEFALEWVLRQLPSEG